MFFANKDMFGIFVFQNSRFCCLLLLSKVNKKPLKILGIDVHVIEQSKIPVNSKCMYNFQVLESLMYSNHLQNCGVNRYFLYDQVLSCIKEMSMVVTMLSIFMSIFLFVSGIETE